MKVLVILTIILSSLLLPISTFAQAGTSSCKSGADGFVDWQKCLAGTSEGGGGGVINPVFINNAYKKIFDDIISVCPKDPKTMQACQQFASTVILNKFVLDIFAITLSIMFLVFSFLIFRSRIMYITAGDNEEQVKKAKKIATAAFIGFLIVFIGLIVGEIFAISISTHLWEIKLFGP